jgi:hypothetical protein
MAVLLKEVYDLFRGKKLLDNQDKFEIFVAKILEFMQ